MGTRSIFMKRFSMFKYLSRKYLIPGEVARHPYQQSTDMMAVLCIHGVTKNRRLRKTANFEGRHIHKDRFREIIRYIRRYFNPIDLAQLEGYYYAEKPLPKHPILITLDDGFANNYYHAFPILKEHDFPATIFLATGYIDNKKTYWVERLEHSISRTRCQMLNINILDKYFALPLKTLREKEYTYMEILRFLKSGFNFSKIDKAVSNICDYLGFSSLTIDEGSEDYRFLTWEQIKEMRKAGITFGAHTVNHVNLAFEDMSNAELEVKESKLAIEKELGAECSTFCYPFGRSGYNEVLEGLLKRSGYKLSFQLGGGLNYKDTNPLLLNRICLAWGMGSRDLVRYIKKTKENNVVHKA